MTNLPSVPNTAWALPCGVVSSIVNSAVLGVSDAEPVQLFGEIETLPVMVLNGLPVTLLIVKLDVEVVTVTVPDEFCVCDRARLRLIEMLLFGSVRSPFIVLAPALSRYTTESEPCMGILPPVMVALTEMVWG